MSSTSQVMCFSCILQYKDYVLVLLRVDTKSKLILQKSQAVKHTFDSAVWFYKNGICHLHAEADERTTRECKATWI